MLPVPGGRSLGSLGPLVLCNGILLELARTMWTPCYLSRWMILGIPRPIVFSNGALQELARTVRPPCYMSLVEAAWDSSAHSPSPTGHFWSLPVIVHRDRRQPSPTGAGAL